ncbi:MAG TPA: TerC family protein [Methylocella sp.]|nr:TerC family protein [Methylocella sp.]
MNFLLGLATDPAQWFALATLITMEIVLGVDNLIFVALLSSKLPPAQAATARRIGVGLSLILRVLLLAGAAYVVSLTKPLFSFIGKEFSWRDLILIAGGLFLLSKATNEIHRNIGPNRGLEVPRPRAGFTSTISQIMFVDLTVSIDSIITAVGMTDHVAIMILAVTIAVLAMLMAAGVLATFIHRHPSIVMLALGFLLLIGTALIADGFGFHLPKGYIYAAMAFAALIEGLNMLASWRRGPPSG